MNQAELIAVFDQDQRIEVEYPGMRREVTSHVVRYVAESESGDGMIIYSRLNEANAAEIIREQVTYFEELGQDFEWKLYDHDQPHDLKERLSADGFIIEEEEAIMALDLEVAAQFLWKPVTHTVQRITDKAQLAQVLAIEEQVWDEVFSGLSDYLGEGLSNYPDQMSVYVAYVADQPASAAWIYFPKGSQFAGLWGGSTLSGFRKQGLYTALLAVRAQEAKARGVRYLTVDASPMSQPILEQFGFEKFAVSYPCKWKVR